MSDWSSLLSGLSPLAGQSMPGGLSTLLSQALGNRTQRSGWGGGWLTAEEGLAAQESGLDMGGWQGATTDGRFRPPGSPRLAGEQSGGDALARIANLLQVSQKPGAAPPQLQPGQIGQGGVRSSAPAVPSSAPDIQSTLAKLLGGEPSTIGLQGATGGMVQGTSGRGNTLASMLGYGQTAPQQFGWGGYTPYGY